VPELPEVENIAQSLRDEIIGLKIKDVCVRRPNIIRGAYMRQWRKAADKLINRAITAVTRRGKRLIIFTDSDLAILVQFGMTGKFLLGTNSVPLDKHTHFYINFMFDRQLRLVDPRRFGRVWFMEHPGQSNLDQTMLNAGMSKLGLEPFGVTARQFRQLLDSKRVIKTILLDQTRIAGLGNIYVDESLFRAGLHPGGIAADIEPAQAEKLRRAVVSVLKSAIIHGGTTFSDFRNAYGEMGRFRRRLKVYQRQGSPCPRCKTPIERMVIAGRGSHFCPECQPKK